MEYTETRHIHIFHRNFSIFAIFSCGLPRRNFSLVARYSLKFTCCSLLVGKSLVTRCKIRSLLVTELARCKKLLVTRCKICSLLVAEVACFKKPLVTPLQIPDSHFEKKNTQNEHIIAHFEYFFACHYSKILWLAENLNEIKLLIMRKSFLI